MRTENFVKEKRKKTLIFDIILIVALLVLSLSVFLIFKFTRSKGAYAEVTVDGEAVARYSLKEDGEFVLNGGTNVLVIKDGAAYMKSATCPDKTCITRHERGISLDGETITCLPNRVRIEIVGGEGL